MEDADIPVTVPVQGDGPYHLPENHPARVAFEQRSGPCRVPGTITRSEQAAVYERYAERYGRGQTAMRIAERGGFSYNEIVSLTGGEPKTWKPRWEGQK